MPFHYFESKELLVLRLELDKKYHKLDICFTEKVQYIP